MSVEEMLTKKRQADQQSLLDAYTKGIEPDFIGIEVLEARLVDGVVKITGSFFEIVPNPDK